MRTLAVIVLVPEATVHENDFSAAGESQVRFARKIVSVDSIAIAY
jgi:hypothetical protein